MKKIYNLGSVLVILLASASMALAKWPVAKVNDHPSFKQFTQLLKEAQLQHARLSQSGFPDSVVISSWDNGAWAVENNAGIRYQNGRVSQLFFYVNGLPLLSYNFTYNASGRATNVETLLSLPGQSPQVITRFTMNYDANGNQTSMLVYEQTNGVLGLSSGDSLAITYSGGVPSQAIRSFYDRMATVPAWINEQRMTNFTFGPNGQPTGVIMTPWDETTNAWLTAEDLRYSNVVWNFGYAGFSTVFGSLMDISQFLFTELPFAQNDYQLSPSDYVEEGRSSGNFVNQWKLTSTLVNSRVSQIMEQQWANNAWVDNNRVVFTYAGTNMTLALIEANSNGNWIPEFRESWMYDASNNLTEEKQETQTGTAWETLSGEKHILDYTPDNRVYRWVRQSWDQTTSSYVNTEKREYYFGNFGLSTAELAKSALKVYPNPVQTDLWIEALNMDNALLQVYSVNGQLLIQEQLVAEQTVNAHRVDVSVLPQGLYRVVLSSSNGRQSQTVVKF
jgi:hypothetical protein